MLPFATKEEKNLFTTQYAIISKKTEEDLAIWWCSRVDGINIFPKLPVHFRMHLRKWLKGNRIENSVKAAKKGADKLKEINDKLSPFYSGPADTASTSAASALESSGADAITRAFPVIKRPPAMPQPTLKVMHNKPYTLVGSTMLGTDPGAGVAIRKMRGNDKNKRTPKMCPKCVGLKMYDNNLEHRCAAVGRGRECDYFDDSNKRRCWRC